METICGIYIGYKDCCVGIYRNNQVDIVANDAGRRNTPFIILFDVK